MARRLLIVFCVDRMVRYGAAREIAFERRVWNASLTSLRVEAYSSTRASLVLPYLRAARRVGVSELVLEGRRAERRRTRTLGVVHVTPPCRVPAAVTGREDRPVQTYGDLLRLASELAASRFRSPHDARDDVRDRVGRFLRVRLWLVDVL